MYILFIHVSVDGHLVCFCTLATVNTMAVNNAVHLPFCISVFVFFECIPRSGIAESYDSSIFSFFEEPPYCFPQRLHRFTLPGAVYKHSLFSISLPTFVICGVSDDRHPDRYEVIPHGSFNLHLSDDYCFGMVYY